MRAMLARAPPQWAHKVSSPRPPSVHARNAELGLRPSVSVTLTKSREAQRLHAVKTFVVPLMIATSGIFMAVAWLGHLRIKEKGFLVALALSWAIVLPEYVLNVTATRLGHGTYTGAQMGAMHLCSGVCFVALVSRFVLGERFSWHQVVGLVLLAVGMVLVLTRTHGDA